MSEETTKTTIEELKNNNSQYEKLICHFDKAKICKIEKIDLIIDDSLANCKKVPTENTINRIDK